MGEWVKLPDSANKLDEVLERIGIDVYYEEYFITDYESFGRDIRLEAVSCYTSYGYVMDNR